LEKVHAFRENETFPKNLSLSEKPWERRTPFHTVLSANLSIPISAVFREFIRIEKPREREEKFLYFPTV
jgi:hypothetical protein